MMYSSNNVNDKEDINQKLDIIKSKAKESGYVSLRELNAKLVELDIAEELDGLLEYFIKENLELKDDDSVVDDASENESVVSEDVEKLVI